MADATLDALFDLRDLFEDERNWCKLELHRKTNTPLA